ncbi:MAG: cyclic nucleotide-binding domain-containing protein [Anaerolineales bacterium]|nr:cyclic nucleotide-binding domain-containing protein [Anaerolineales bacterium]
MTIEPERTETPPQTKASFLNQLPIFSQITGDALKTLTGVTKEFEFTRGSIIAYEGDLTEGLYIVRSGQLEPFKLDENRTYQKVEGLMYGAGDWFEDMWLFQPTVHPYTIRARRPGRLILLSNAGWAQYLKDHGSTLNTMFPYFTPEAQTAVLHSRFHVYINRTLRRRTTDTDMLDGEELDEAIGTPPEEMEEELEEELSDKNRSKRYATLKLLPEEVVYFDKRRSSKFFYAQTTALVVLALLLFTVPVILLGTSGVTGMIALGVSGVLSLFPLVAAFINWINWRNCLFLITNKQIVRYELKIFRFQTNIERADLDDVQSVSVLKPNFIANLLKVGSASITTAAQSKVIFFDFIDNPKAVETEIQRISDIQRRRSASQKRAALRNAIEGYFNVPQPLQEVKPTAAPKQLGSYQRFRRFMGEWIGQSEQNGVITYHKHPVSLIRKMIFPTLVLLATGFAFFLFSFLAPAILALPAVAGSFIIFTLINLFWFVWRFEDWRNDTFQITDRYIYDIDRLPFGFREDRKQAELSNVQNVATKQDGFIRTFFNYGDVQVETAGVDSDIVFESVRDPGSVQNDIFAKRNKYRKKQEEAQLQRQRDEYTLMIDLYNQSVQQGRIPNHKPLPAIDDGLAEPNEALETDEDA